MPKRPLFLALAIALAFLASGCGGRAWRAAAAEDTAGAYHRYLRANPDSKFADEARMRLAFVRVRSKPSRQGFQEFRNEFPQSPLVDELRPYLEDAFFDQARRQGSAEAYGQFLEDFPRGVHAPRAAGNQAYLSARGFAGDLSRLAEFAQQHPASDFAAEAERSAASVGLRGRTGFDRVGLVLDVPANIPNADRLARLFTERALAAYQGSPVSLIPMNGASDPRLTTLGARLTISHREREVRSELVAGRSTQAGALAETTVTLSARGQESAIWSETFRFKVPLTERVPGESILLHPRARRAFWEQTFFAPIVSWDTRHTARAPRQLAKTPVAVELLGNRAIVLFGDGEFQLLDLGDPESPVLLGEYRRKRDLAQFEGVALLPGAVAVFGVDGIEIVTLEGVPRRVRAYSRSEVGSIVSLVPLGKDIIAAGNRGLLLIGEDGTVRTVVERQVLGLERRGDRLLFTDGASLYIASLATLKQGRVEGELRLGRGFRPARIRLAGNAAVVLGEPGLVWVDVSSPSRPRVVSRLATREVGEIQDATVIAGRLFLVGPRGLQVSDRAGERVVGSVDVSARHRLDASGRHVVLIGENQLQVVDTSAFVSRRPSAAAVAP